MFLIHDFSLFSERFDRLLNVQSTCTPHLLWVADDLLQTVHLSLTVVKLLHIDGLLVAGLACLFDDHPVRHQALTIDDRIHCVALTLNLNADFSCWGWQSLLIAAWRDVDDTLCLKRCLILLLLEESCLLLKVIPSELGWCENQAVLISKGYVFDEWPSTFHVHIKRSC